jgi:hypothetical protein
MVAMTVEDYYAQGKRCWLRLHEKNGKQHEMPAHHTLEGYLDAYIQAAGIVDDAKSPLVRTAARTGAELTRNPMTTADDGLQPLGNDFSITRTDGSSFTLNLIGYSFGYLGTSGEIDTDTFGIDSGVTRYIIAMDTTNGLNPNAPQNSLPPVDTLDARWGNQIPFQVTEVRLDVGAVFPEPSTLVIAALGAALWFAYACRSRKRIAPKSMAST